MVALYTSDLEKEVRQCATCQQHQKNPPSQPIQPWDWLERLWTRIHMDHVGPVQGKMLLVFVDSYSKWIEVILSSLHVQQLQLKKLRYAFAMHGLPEVVVSDNGTGFASSEFKQFVSKNGVRHLTTTPYHHSSNGLLKKMKGPLESSIPILCPR